MNEKPKYYKCIKLGAIDQFSVNKIYKVRNPNNLNDYGNFVDDKGNFNGFAPYNEESMIPATELEWNLQEGIITPVSKQEDYSYLVSMFKKLNIK